MLFAAIALCLPALGGCSSEHGSRSSARVFSGAGSLPLSGDFAAGAAAFRGGFEEALAASSDSTVSWTWSWHDNGGSAEDLQGWLDSVSTGTAPAPDLLLAGFATAVEGVDLAKIRAPILWFGDGAPVSHPDLWPLWPDQRALRRLLTAWIAQRDTPSVALVLADAAWTPAFLDTAYAGMEVIPHDPLMRRWDREIGQILARRPRTLVFWDRPEDAASLVARPLLARFLPGRSLLLPDGVDAPDGARVYRARPLWQPALPMDSIQSAFLRAWGGVVGRAVATSAMARARDTAASWRSAFRVARCDSARVDPPEGGWLPRMEIVEEVRGER